MKAYIFWYFIYMILTCATQVKFRLQKNQQVTEVLFAVADTSMNEPTKYKQMIKYYYKPIVSDLTKYENKENFHTSLAIFLKHDVVHYTENIDSDRFTITYYGEQDGKDEYWYRFTAFIDVFVSRNVGKGKSRIVLFIAEIPQTILDHLHNLPNTCVILVMTSLNVLSTNFQKVMRPFHFTNQNFLSHVELLNKIKNPEFDQLKSIGEIPSPRNTSCLEGKTIVMILSDVNSYYYHYHFIELLVQLEKYLIIDNNQRVRFNIMRAYHPTYGFNDIPALKLKYNYTGIGTMTGGADQVYLMAYFRKLGITGFVAGNMRRRNIPYIGIKMSLTKLYESPYRTGNTIHTNYEDVGRNKAVRYIMDTIIDVGCIKSKASLIS